MCALSQSAPCLLYSDPIDVPVKSIVEFRLIYGGSLLKSATQNKSRAWEKHQIRLEFHRQLKRLWETHPVFRFYNEPQHWDRSGHRLTIEHHDLTTIDAISKQFQGFVPVVNAGFGTVCELDVLLLRNEPAGQFVGENTSGGGDIDNRLKVLFDALKIPKIGQIPPAKEGTPPDPDPFFVLLQDDGLITAVRVTTDRLLAVENDSLPSEACVVLNVTVKVADPTLSPYQLAL